MTRGRKYNRLIFLAVLLLVMSAGCSWGQGEEQHSKEQEDLIVVGVSQVGSESVWRTANTASIQDVFTRENGYFLMFDNARQKPENQIRAVRRFISQRVDYIVISPIVETGWDTVFREAKEAGIPLIVMDREADVSSALYTCWVGSDFVEEGVKAGEWLEDYLAGTRFNQDDVNIVVLQGTAGSSAMLGRTSGFESVVQKHPNWKILEQVDADFTTAKGKEEMQRLLKKYPSIDVVVSQNDDMTFGALEAIEEAGKTAGTGGEITVISFDSVSAALEKVKAGTIQADIECNPLLGPYIEEIIQELEQGRVPEKECYVEEKVFTQKNVLSVLGDRAY